MNFDLNSYLSTHLDDISKWFLAIAGAMATLGTAISKILFHFRSKVDITKDEGALIDFALQVEGSDLAYQKFLKDIVKEKTVSALFNVPIKTGEIGALMELYNRGDATVADIRRALPYIKLNPSKALILTAKEDIFLLWVSKASLYLGFGITLLGCLAIPFTKGFATIHLLVVILMYFLFILIVAVRAQGLFIASRLKSLQKAASKS